jgi:hypothetical protein
VQSGLILSKGAQAQVRAHGPAGGFLRLFSCPACLSHTREDGEFRPDAGRLLVAQETNDLGRPVVDPTQPAKGKPLLTLKDAADYIDGITVASKTWLKV